MTDYERTTTRETTTTPPVATEPYVAPAAAPAPVATSVRTTDTAYVASGPGPTTYAARVVTFLFGILQVALILRIVLLLLVANRGNDVVQFVMNITQPFVDPFIGMFSMNRVTADQGSVLDVAAIVALIGWTLIEALILAAIRIFSRRHGRGRLARDRTGELGDLRRARPATSSQPRGSEHGPRRHDLRVVPIAVVRHPEAGGGFPCVAPVRIGDRVACPGQQRRPRPGGPARGAAGRS